ncbi:MAG: serine hydrolase [Verrucomicrobiales bacterium]|nr:serine hydrolase [Verrucomicrobiales bacterium]
MKTATVACILASLLTVKPDVGAFDWKAADATRHGVALEALEALRVRLAERNTKAILVIRDDRVLLEWYAPGHGPEVKHYTASLAKAVIGGIATALALDDHALELADPVARFVPAWGTDPQRCAITFAHLGSHTSGIEDAEADDLPHDRLPGWKGDFWQRLAPPRDPFTRARDTAPVVFAPGTDFAYSNPGIAMLTYGVAAAWQARANRIGGSRPASVRDALRDRVFRRIGIADGNWNCGYGQTVEVDGLPLVAAWGGGNFTARALARVGRLMLRRGDWDGGRVLSEGAVEAITRPVGTPGGCGIGWWTNAGGRWPSLPRDAFAGGGAGHQILLVVPSLNLVAVRSGANLDRVDSAEGFWDAAERHLFAPLMRAIEAADPHSGWSPLPASRVIRGVRWAPAETIRRFAPGSDNWPMATGPDGWVYTAYGDGHGFAPGVDRKLSLGFARFRGWPDAFNTENVRSPSGECFGDGARGLKASGLLAVDGTLYLLARNATNATLAWSGDNARSWAWADWRFTSSFGCPTFIEPGAGTTGATREWIYVLSPDADDAYTPADAQVLARVPQHAVREPENWEFFSGTDAAGNPRWSSAVADRKPVLELPGRCYRPSVHFNAACGRYLLVQALPSPELDHRGGTNDLRFRGGLAIFDAPEPWGPWSTVYYNEAWDVAPGESAHLPAAMTDAGGGGWLVFSGEDAFSLRRVAFERVQKQ